MRVQATAVAERIITDWARNGVDKNRPGEQARLERLFGEGFDAKRIQLDDDGNLDVNDSANQAAVMRFVNDSVLRPNASLRTIWGSDPHWSSLWHLKSFTWTMHKVFLENALHQAKLGDYRPAMVLASIYLPVAIAGGAVKEMLIPGEEPPWMQGGLDGLLEYGAARAGLGGVPQYLIGDAGIGLLGPTASQIRDLITEPIEESALAALPGGNLLRRLAA